MNAKQFAWAYLVKFGDANLKPSFYGGKRPVDQNLVGKEVNWQTDYTDTAIELIKQHGVKWSKTDAPENEKFSVFTDTFHDPDYEEWLTGELVLNNGQRLYYSGQLEVGNVFDMMAKMQELVDFYNEVFGDGA